MDIFKLNAEAVRGLDDTKCREAELDIRKELNQYKLDVYANSAANSAKGKQLRKSLARIKTVMTERSKNKATIEKKA